MEKEAVNKLIFEATGLSADFCNDLNAMHEAEETLTNEQRNRYVNQLHNIAVKSESQPMADFEWCNATAAQRAEAFLKTLNL